MSFYPDSGLKVQKENLLEAKRLAREDNDRARIKHDKDMKELEKVDILPLFLVLIFVK